MSDDSYIAIQDAFARANHAIMCGADIVSSEACRAIEEARKIYTAPHVYLKTEVFKLRSMQYGCRRGAIIGTGKTLLHEKCGQVKRVGHLEIYSTKRFEFHYGPLLDGDGEIVVKEKPVDLKHEEEQAQLADGHDDYGKGSE